MAHHILYLPHFANIFIHREAHFDFQGGEALTQTLFKMTLKA